MGSGFSRRQWLRMAGGWVAGLAGMLRERPTRAADAGAGDAAQEASATPRIGLALGAGGANGLAHIAMLEVFEELGLRPHRITGSSIGAVIGALFCSGLSAADIRGMVVSTFSENGEGILDRLLSEQALHWIELLELDLGSGGLLNSERILSGVYRAIETRRFENLDPPLAVVAADLWTGEQVVLDSGELMPAVQASMALPGVFTPILLDGRVLIDGGTVNPVPWDLLAGDCDIVVGIDVSGVRTPGSGTPGYFETLFNSAKVMQQAIVEAKRQAAAPDIFIAPQVRDIRALEFHRADEVFAQAATARDQLRRQLRTLLNRYGNA